MKATRHSRIWLNVLLLVSLTLTLTPIEALRASAPEAQLTPLRLPQLVKTWATPQTPVQDPPPGWLDRVTKDVTRAEYEVTWQDATPLADMGAAYQAPNRAQNLRAYFTPDSLHLVPRTTTGPAWRLNLAVTGYGSGGATQRVAGAKLEAARNGVQYERGDLVEWYVWGASSVLYHAYASAAPNTTNGGHWGYLKLNSDAARLQYVVLEGGGSRRSPMLYVDAAAPVLEDLTIRGSGGAGLLAVDALSLTLYNVQTASNVGDGIQLRGGDHYRIISATAQYNQGHGLRLEDAGHVVVTGTLLAHNARGYGIWTADNATSVVLQDNVVADNAYAAHLPLDHQVMDTIWTDNRVNQIALVGGDLPKTSTWAAPIPYRVDADVIVGASQAVSLTLVPGARLLFGEGRQLVIEQNGILSAVGTLTAPITMERADPDAEWGGAARKLRYTSSCLSDDSGRFHRALPQLASLQDHYHGSPYPGEQ